MAREKEKIRIKDIATRDQRLNDKRLKGEDRAALKEAIKKEIQAELYGWLLTQPADRFEKLPETSSEYLYINLPVSTNNNS